MIDQANLVNRGCITLNAGRDGQEPEGTIIVSGLGRSGTSLVSRLLKSAGLPMGEDIDDVVFEDNEIYAALKTGNMRMMADLIKKRNNDHLRWGFKLPNIQGYLTPADLARFRNPRMILVFRDMVAVSVRNAIAEARLDSKVLLETIAGNVSMLDFARRAKYPVLLVSYEKIITLPEETLDRIMDFAGLDVVESERTSLLRVINPNDIAYAQTARKTYEGHVDGIFDGNLYGWCWETSALEPLDIEVYRDGICLGKFKANHLRSDLKDAGKGNGYFGFCVDKGLLGPRKRATINVVVAGTDVPLDGSGKTIAEYERPPGNRQVEPLTRKSLCAPAA